MKLFFIIFCLFIIPSSFAKKTLDAYDPFADYSEFENTVEEQENINFFRNGRFLSIGVIGGIRLFTLNMYRLYNIGPHYGLNINYFFNLISSIQVYFARSDHSINTNSSKGKASFSTMGIDMKYFTHPDLFQTKWSWLKLYGFLGFIHVSSDTPLIQEQEHIKDDGYGVNVGLGAEFHFIKKIYFGIQYAFQYVNLKQEDIPLKNTGSEIFKPYGDWMNFSTVLGVNF